MNALSTARAAALLAMTACSSSHESDDPEPAPLRPGVEDSSKAYKGTPSPAENAFWEAIRSGDDAARAEAVTKLGADVAEDPSNGYSEFLVGASSFMPSSDVLRALASGSPLPSQPLPTPHTIEVLEQAKSNLTDPLYLGFSAALLGTLQTLFGDPTTGADTLAFGRAKNPAATSFSIAANKLRGDDWPGALDAMYALFEFCFDGAVARDGRDADEWVARGNAATLVHRECYSGYHAVHGTEGVVLLLGDIHALAGDTDAAARYYTAMASATNYATWPLKPLADRRISGVEPAVAAQAVAEAACIPCHTASLP